MKNTLLAALIISGAPSIVMDSPAVAVKPAREGQRRARRLAAEHRQRQAEVYADTPALPETRQQRRARQRKENA